VKNTELDVSFLRECFDLDEFTGSLTWKERPKNHFSSERGWRHFKSKCAGKLAVKTTSDGYHNVGVFFTRKYVTLKVHRVVFAIYHGRWPLLFG
jgi:hypothetical protein